jgi:CDP-diglyceride synthetase
MMFTLIFSFIFSRILGQFQWFVCPYNDRECTLPDVMLDRTYDLPRSMIDLFNNFGIAVPLTVTLMPIQLHGLWLGLFASLVAPFGGFFASGIKRAYKVKDFNNLIPGHGGIMDRVDCQFIMACYTRVHYITWIRPAAAITVGSIFSQARYLGDTERQELIQALMSIPSSA